MRPALLTLLLAASLLLPGTAAAQFGGVGGPPLQGLTVGYGWVDFCFDGDGDPQPSFDFAEPVFGVAYARPRLHLSLAFGSQAAPVGSVGGRDLGLLDVALTTWGDLFTLYAPEEGGTRLTLPLLLHSNFRRVSPEGEETSLTSFSVTTLGLGTGLAFSSRLSRRVHIEARATPIFALATRSFADGTGTARLLDADALLLAGPFFGRLGLALGYGFRGQVWRVGSSDLFRDVTVDLDYRGTLHFLRLGVSW